MQALHPDGGPAAATPALAELVARLPRLRVQRLDLPGLGNVWLKQAERLSLRLRLQKGDPVRAFEAERQALRTLGRLGLPVAPVLAEGADFLVLPDLGANLLALLRDEAVAQDARLAGFAAAGAALGRLHRAGIAHGRPVLRDICWDGRAARLIDLERCAPGGAGPRARAADVVMLVQSWFTERPEPGPELAAFLAAWQAEAGDGAAAGVRALARRLRWLGPLARGLSRLRPRSRELAAVPRMLAHLAG